MKKRKICIFTGTRAEYGLLKPLIDELKNIDDVELQLVITGMHLSPEFGLTYKDINLDGISKVEKVEILLSSDTPVGISKAMGLGLISFSEVLDRLKPDLFIGLGDRFELLAAVSAAMVARIPVAHLYGGEATEGSIDEPIRHSITKMSHLHFTSTEKYRRRVIQLGENPKSVFNVGAIGIDNIKKMKLLNKRELEKQFNFKITKKTLLVTFHPVTLESSTSKEQFSNLLNAIDKFKDIRTIFTKPNADTDGRVIISMIDEYVSQNKHKSISFASMGQLQYLSTLKYVGGMIGNSSSGLIEAPSFKIGTINIGDRQKGRIKAKSVIDSTPNTKDIERAIEKLFSDKFQDSLKEVVNPYELKDYLTSKRIKDIILSYSLKNIIKKEFYNLKFKL
ncbi:MAG: UDP-N-acetylglucosamine 2-epimerase [Candidatus Helarchaeota archaeon]